MDPLTQKTEYGTPEELYYDIGNGETVAASQIQEWKKGYQRQSDYTKKTSEIARERDELMRSKESIMSEKQQMDQILEDYNRWSYLIDNDADQAIDYIKNYKEKKRGGAKESSATPREGDRNEPHSDHEARQLAQAALDELADFKLNNAVTKISSEFKDQYGIDVDPMDIYNGMVHLQSNDPMVAAKIVYEDAIAQARDRKSALNFAENLKKQKGNAKILPGSGHHRTVPDPVLEGNSRSKTYAEAESRARQILGGTR